MTDLTGYSFGRYRFLEKLGEGGMATVYKAFDERLEREVAIKTLRTEQFSPAQIQQVLQRFDREAKSLAKLSHPNIVSILDYGENEGAPYLVMEFMPGGTLKDKLGAAMPWREALKMIAPVARALAYAHEHGVIHRDVKPANILLRGDGTPVLTDFGIAKLLEGMESGHTLTASGVGIGTPEYMAPEQGMGGKVDGRADMYALGATLYELVAGRKPFEADTPMAVLVKHMTDPLPPPRQFAADLPAAVEELIRKAMAKQPDERYASMAEFVAALEALLYAEAQTGERTLAAHPAAFSPKPEATRLSAAPHVSESASPKKNSALTIALGAGAALLLLCGLLGGGALLLISAAGGTETAAPSSAVSAPITATPPTSRPAAEIPAPKPDYVVKGCNPFDDCPASPNIRMLYPEGVEFALNVEYPISISPNTSPLFYYGWCAADEPTLDDNMTKIDFVFEVGEDDALPYAKTRRYSEKDENAGEPYFCDSIGAVIGEWTPNKTYRVVIGLRIKEEVNDGWNIYPPGDFLYAYLITADPAVLPVENP